MDKDKNRFSIILFFFREYKLQSAIMCGLSILAGGLEATNIAIIYPILNTAFEGGFGEQNLILSIFSRIANLLPINDAFIAHCVLFIIIAILTFAIRYATIAYRMRISTRIVEATQNKIFDKYIKADYQFFTEHKQGELIYNVATAPQRLSTLITLTTNIISQIILSISVILLLFSLSWQGTLAVMLIGALYLSVSRYFANRVSYLAGKGVMEAIRESNVILNEVISGIRQIKAFAIIEDRITRFHAVTKKHWHYSRRRAIWSQIPTPALTLILYFFIGLTAILIRNLVTVNFAELIPIFGTFAFSVFRLAPIMSTISGLTMEIMGALPDCETVYSTLNQNLTNIVDGDNQIDSFKSKIELRNVTFSYKEENKILNNISVTFEKGKTTAIVGRSGSGKTTIINLLLRLFDVDSGEINIDGLNIRQYKLASWLNKVGIVSQDTFVFNDTIRNNITFYSNYSDEAVIKAAEFADAHTFISNLPDGYDTVIGDRGVKLSGGQRQRIAVARAMIREPEILIFDEATNALDSISESAIQKAIRTLSTDHTLIIIAHRLSTIIHADKIIVLDNGAIVEEGTQKQLLENGGTYWQLYQNQPVETG